jgi:hypothetical protein
MAQPRLPGVVAGYVRFQVVAKLTSTAETRRKAAEPHVRVGLPSLLGGLDVAVAVVLASLGYYPAQQESHQTHKSVHFPQEVREIGFG